MHMHTFPRTLLATALVLAGGLAHADDWFVRVGPAHVEPKSNNGSLAGGALRVDIDSNTQLGLILGYHFTPNIAVELLAATPFSHTVSLNGARAVDFKHLPPTLSLQYYFAPDGQVNPFVGLGVNYTWTYSERETGPVAGASVGLGNSWGLAAQAGLVFKLSDRWDVVAEARWIDIDADVKLDGAKIGTANVDPLVYGLYLGYRF
jgi:outer membrane protein